MFAVVLCTTPKSEVETITHPLIKEKLVACINVTDVDSFFMWDGKMESEKESLLIMKTRTDRIDDVIERVKGLHSYDVPEIIVLPIISGSKDYLDWVKESAKIMD